MATAGRANFVYFARHKHHGLIKIGTSINPRVRASGQHAKIVACIVGGRKREKREHRRWAKICVWGEWFRPTRELCRYIKRVGTLGFDRKPRVKRYRLETNPMKRRTVRIVVLLTREEERTLKRLARKRKEPFSETVREAISRLPKSRA